MYFSDQLVLDLLNKVKTYFEEFDKNFGQTNIN